MLQLSPVEINVKIFYNLLTNKFFDSDSELLL